MIRHICILTEGETFVIIEYKSWLNRKFIDYGHEKGAKLFKVFTRFYSRTKIKSDEQAVGESDLTDYRWKLQRRFYKKILGAYVGPLEGGKNYPWNHKKEIKKYLKGDEFKPGRKVVIRDWYNKVVYISYPIIKVVIKDKLVRFGSKK